VWVNHPRKVHPGERVGVLIPLKVPNPQGNLRAIGELFKGRPGFPGPKVWGN